MNDYNQRFRQHGEAARGFLKEFREFAVRGNVVDLAVGIIIGGAFSRIVDSLVKDIVMPPIGLLIRGVQFEDLKIILQKADPLTTTIVTPAAGATAAIALPKNGEEIAIRYGSFLSILLQFTIIAFAVYVMVRQINRLKRQQPPATRECPFCATNIPMKASRCPQCTSEVTPTAPA